MSMELEGAAGGYPASMPTSDQLDALYDRARNAIRTAHQVTAISTALATTKAPQQLTPTRPPRAPQPVAPEPAPIAPL